MKLLTILLELARLKAARRCLQAVNWSMRRRSRCAALVLMTAASIAVAIAPWIQTDEPPGI